MIDLRNLKNGDLNTLGWVVLKSSIVMGDKYDKSLAKLNIIKSEDKYWQKLVNINYERSILFPDNYGYSRFDNNDIPFCMLKPTILSDYDVALKHLNE